MLGNIAAISFGGAASTIFAVAIVEVRTTASVRAEIDNGFEKLAACDGITWSRILLTATCRQSSCR